MRVMIFIFDVCGWIGDFCCEVEYLDKKCIYLEIGEVMC